MDRVRRRVRPAEPEALTDPETAAYLNQAGNRLRRIPDEVYALIVREIETGIAQSEGVPAIRDRVQRVLTATGSEYWPNPVSYTHLTLPSAGTRRRSRSGSRPTTSAPGPPTVRRTGSAHCSPSRSAWEGRSSSSRVTRAAPHKRSSNAGAAFCP